MKWYIVVRFEDPKPPTLLIGPRSSEKEIELIGNEVRVGQHIPKEYKSKKYEWGTVKLRGIKV